MTYNYPPRLSHDLDPRWIIAVGLASGLLLFTVFVQADDHTDTICHRGVEITIADPAIFQAHLDHGDCIGTCLECEGRCCFEGGITLELTQYDCAKADGRFHWNKEASCFEGSKD